jgi:AGZA family xanthine/uracil permease-like MFS transporter
MHLRTEAIAGITTFFTMAYIVVVNPTILSTPGTGMAFSGVLTETVLVLVGASMFKSVNHIDFRKIEEGLPAFLTIILIPLTFSITQGILWGFISHAGLDLTVGRRREIHPVMTCQRSYE